MTAEMMRDIDIRKVSAKTLADRGSVRVDKTLPQAERLAQYEDGGRRVEVELKYHDEFAALCEAHRELSKGGRR